MTYTIWPARPADLALVMELLHRRVEWLEDRGSDQWSTYQRWEPEMVDSIAEHRTLLLRRADTYEAVGTLTVSTEADPDFWTADEQQVPALYLSKLATRPDYAGRGLGRLMLNYAMYLAAADRLSEVRMDVWKTATELHRYYETEGWAHVRTVEQPGRWSGALFTRHVEVPKVNMPPSELEVRPPTGTMDQIYINPESYPNGVMHFDG
jgi:ribosomal protein S18 acetylase RimI-like enzyme